MKKNNSGSENEVIHEVHHFTLNDVYEVYDGMAFIFSNEALVIKL